MPTVVTTPTKAAVTLFASATVVGGTPGVGSWIDLTGKVGPFLLTAQITNGGTAPSAGTDWVIETSTDNGTTKREVSRQNAGGSASDVTPLSFELTEAAMYVRITFSGNSQDVTAVSEAQAVSSYSTT